MSPCADCGVLGSTSSALGQIDGFGTPPPRKAFDWHLPSRLLRNNGSRDRQRSWMHRRPILGGTLMGASAGFFFQATVGLVNDMG